MLVTDSSQWCRRRRTWIWTIAVVLVVLVGFVGLQPSTRTMIQFLGVSKGMQTREVLASLGPPHFRSGGPSAPEPFSGGMGWLIGSVSYYVEFKQGIVVSKRMHSDDPTVRWMLGRWLGWNLL